jgi:hypothetical protein
MTAWRLGPVDDRELTRGIKMLSSEADRNMLIGRVGWHDLYQRMADVLAAVRDLPSARSEVNRHWTMQDDQRDDGRNA